MIRVFIDMDGVIVDFARRMREHNMTSAECKTQRGSYLLMEPVAGALASVRALIGMGYEVWIATKPPTGISWAYADKVEWILQHLPELKRRIIVTHDKGLLGDVNDILLDDRPHKANCIAFKGMLIYVRDAAVEWPMLVKWLSMLKRAKIGTVPPVTPFDLLSVEADGTISMSSRKLHKAVRETT